MYVYLVANVDEIREWSFWEYLQTTYILNIYDIDYSAHPTPPHLVHILSSNRPSSYLFSLSVLWFMWPCSIVYPSPRPFLSSILFSWRLFCCLFCLLPKPLTLPIWSNPSPLHYLSHALYVFSSRLYCEFSLSLCYLRPLCCIFSP